MRSFSMMRLLCGLKLPIDGVGVERGLYWPIHKLEYDHYNRFCSRHCNLHYSLKKSYIDGKFRRVGNIN
jgi:hypothetical protein